MLPDTLQPGFCKKSLRLLGCWAICCFVGGRLRDCLSLMITSWLLTHDMMSAFANVCILIQSYSETKMKTCWPKWVRTTEVVASFYGEATQASPPSGQQGRDGEEPVDTNLIWYFFSNWFWNIPQILNAWTAERCMVIKVLEVVVSWAMARHPSRIWLYNFKFSRR